MARHGKVVRKNPTKAIVLSVGISLVALLAAAAVFLATNGVFASLLASVFPDKNSTTTSTSSTVPSTTTTTQPKPIVPVELPGQVRGVRLTAGVDFAAGEDKSPRAVQAEIVAFFDQLQEWNFNTVLLPITEDGVAYYPSKVLPAADFAVDGFDVIQYIADTAKNYGFSVLGVLDVGITAGALDPLTIGGEDKLAALAKEAAAYRFDAVLFTDYGYAYRAEPHTEEFERQTRYDTYEEFAGAAVSADRDGNYI